MSFYKDQLTFKKYHQKRFKKIKNLLISYHEYFVSLHLRLIC